MDSPGQQAKMVSGIREHIFTFAQITFVQMTDTGNLLWAKRF